MKQPIMKIVMPNDLFNGNDEAKFTRMSENCKPKWEKSYSRWVVEKPIGECSTITKDGDFITFFQQVHYDNPDIFTQVSILYGLTQHSFIILNPQPNPKRHYETNFAIKINDIR